MSTESLQLFEDRLRQRVAENIANSPLKPIINALLQHAEPKQLRLPLEAGDAGGNWGTLQRAADKLLRQYPTVEDTCQEWRTEQSAAGTLLAALVSRNRASLAPVTPWIQALLATPALRQSRTWSLLLNDQLRPSNPNIRVLSALSYRGALICGRLQALDVHHQVAIPETPGMTLADEVDAFWSSLDSFHKAPTLKSSPASPTPLPWQ